MKEGRHIKSEYFCIHVIVIYTTHGDDDLRARDTRRPPISFLGISLYTVWLYVRVLHGFYIHVCLYAWYDRMRGVGKLTGN